MHTATTISFTPLVFLSFGHVMTSEKPGWHNPLDAVNSVHVAPVDSVGSAGPPLSWESLPVSSSAYPVQFDDSRKNVAPIIGPPCEDHLTKMSGGTVTSARKSRSGDQPRSVTVNGAHRAAADHEMPHTVAQRHDVYVPRVSRTTTMHYAPPLLVQDLADRVSEIELSVQDVKDSQEKAHIATGLLGIAVLGIGLTRLYNHWRSSKIRPATPKIGKGSYTDADAKTTGNSHVLRPRKGCAAVNSVHEGNVSCSDGSEAGFSPSDNDSVPDKCHTDNGNSKLRLAVQPAHLPHAEPEVDYHELIPEPREAVRCLLRSINDLEPPHALALGDSAWCVGFSRHIGPRDTQEDYVIAFEVGRTRVCLLADGAGGHPLGEYASYHGILGAAAYIAEELAFAPEDQDLRLEEVARQSVHHAAFAIAVHAAAAGIPQRLALRSTLIVVLATDNEFSWANLGDGGGWSVRATPREYDSFLVPAKESNRIN